MNLITTGITPRCINFAGKRPNVLCIALEGRVSTSSQPMDLLCASVGGGGAAWVHPSTCNGSSRMCQTLHGNKLLHSHWHLAVSDCRTNSTTLQLFRFSSLASNSHVLLSGEQTVWPKRCRQTCEKICIQSDCCSPSPTASARGTQAVCHCQRALCSSCGTAVKGSHSSLHSSLLSFYESKETSVLSPFSIAAQHLTTARFFFFSFFQLFSNIFTETCNRWTLQIS